jgi:hypothetical protein
MPPEQDGGGVKGARTVFWLGGDDGVKSLDALVDAPRAKHRHS